MLGEGNFQGEIVERFSGGPELLQDEGHSFHKSASLLEEE